MKDTNKKTVTIIGSGLAGSFLAILLAKRGYSVAIYERFTEEEIMGDYSASRSYNLTFYSYGMEALKVADVWNTIEPSSVKLSGLLGEPVAHSSPVLA